MNKVIKNIKINKINQMNKINKQINAIIHWIGKNSNNINKNNKNNNNNNKNNKIRITVKDVFKVKNTCITMGVRCDTVDKDDDKIIKLIKKLKYLIVGKTNVPELLAKTYTYNPLYGETLNPLNLNKTPGGSSGGEAAAIVANLSDIGLCTDYGGSARIPASYCGLYSFVPNNSNKYELKYLNYVPPNTNLIHNRIGFMSKDINLIEKLNNELEMSEMSEMSGDSELSKSGTLDKKKLTIGYYIDTELFKPCDTTVRLMMEACKKLSVEYKIKEFVYKDWNNGNKVYSQIFDGAKWISHTMNNFDYDYYSKNKEKVERNKIKQNDFKKQFISSMKKQKIDIIMCPTVAFCAPNIKNNFVKAEYVTYYTKIFNLIDFACGSVPYGVVKHNEIEYNGDAEIANALKNGIDMPIGIQIAGVSNKNVLNIIKYL